jgi:hypothetical protein
LDKVNITKNSKKVIHLPKSELENIN